MQKKIIRNTLFIFLFIISLTTYVFADEPIIYSQAAILVDSKDGTVIYEKNANEKMYPASTTKILTAIIALESCSLNEKVTASSEAINSIKSGYTIADIQVGETLSMEDLLYALLIKSANEAANVIAEHIAGNVDNFANIMNSKAKELGCQNTHFVNANGVHNDDHYTTASDLAIIAEYCMKNETFRKIVSTQYYSLPSTPQYTGEERVLKNSNSLLIPEHTYYYPYAIGMKTGFTSEAKNCLIAASKKDDLELISIVLHAEQTEDGRSARYCDSINLLEYGNNNYVSHYVEEKKVEIKTDIKDNLEFTEESEMLFNEKNQNTSKHLVGKPIFLIAGIMIALLLILETYFNANNRHGRRYLDS